MGGAARPAAWRPVAVGAALSGTTTAALDGNRVVYFTDVVRDGEVVDVYETFEQAEADEGPCRKMRVYLDGGELLEQP